MICLMGPHTMDRGRFLFLRWEHPLLDPLWTSIFNLPQHTLLHHFGTLPSIFKQGGEFLFETPILLGNRLCVGLGAQDRGLLMHRLLGMGATEKTENNTVKTQIVHQR